MDLIGLTSVNSIFF